MKSSGRVKYENYAGRTARGLKNKRVKKREMQRAIIREMERERKRDKQKKAYAKTSDYDVSNFR